MPRTAQPADDAALRRDHLDGRRLELGEIALGRVLDQQAFVAAVVRLAHRGLHADFGGHAGEHQVRDAARLQRLVQAGRPEHALARLVDDDLAASGASSATIWLPGSPATRMRPIAPRSPMRRPGLPRRRFAGGQSERSGWCASRVWTIGSPAAEQRDQRGARSGTIAASRDTSLPSAAPKPPGSMKSRCMSMTTSAVRAGSSAKG